MKYLLIDEYSFVGQGLFGWIDSRCRQATDEYSFVGQGLFGWIDSRCRQATAKTNILYGGNSVLLLGDLAQLSPIGDKVPCHLKSKTEKQTQGFLMYNQFNKVVNLTVNQRVRGNNKEQLNFRPLLNRACNELDRGPLKTPQNVSNV